MSIADDILGRYSPEPRENYRPETHPDDDEFVNSILDKYTQKVSQPEEGLFSKGLGAVGSVLGAPKAGIDYLARAGARAQGLNVPDEATTGSMVRNALGFNQGYETSGYGDRLAGKAVEFGTDLLTDPVTYAMGAAPKPLAKAAGAAFTGLMGAGALQEGGRALESYQKEGFTPKVAEEAFGTALSAGGAFLGAKHLLPAEHETVAKLIRSEPPERLQARLESYTRKGRPELADLVQAEMASRQANNVSQRPVVEPEGVQAALDASEAQVAPTATPSTSTMPQGLNASWLEEIAKATDRHPLVEAATPEEAKLAVDEVAAPAESAVARLYQRLKAQQEPQNAVPEPTQPVSPERGVSTVESLPGADPRGDGRGMVAPEEPVVEPTGVPTPPPDVVRQPETPELISVVGPDGMRMVMAAKKGARGASDFNPLDPKKAGKHELQAATLTRKLGDDSWASALAERGYTPDEVIGVAHFAQGGEKLSPGMVYVAPEFQRQGIASAMYDAAKSDSGLPIAQGVQRPEGRAFRAAYDKNASAPQKVSYARLTPEQEAEARAPYKSKTSAAEFARRRATLEAAKNPSPLTPADRQLRQQALETGADPDLVQKALQTQEGRATLRQFIQENPGPNRSFVLPEGERKLPSWEGGLTGTAPVPERPELVAQQQEAIAKNPEAFAPFAEAKPIVERETARREADQAERQAVKEQKRVESRAEAERLLTENQPQRLPLRPDVQYSTAPKGFYSQLERAAEKIPQAMKGADLYRYLTDQKRGVKAEEIKWTGLDDFLRERAGTKVTPQDVQDFIKGNKVDVKEVTLAEEHVDSGYQRANQLLERLVQSGVAEGRAENIVRSAASGNEQQRRFIAEKLGEDSLKALDRPTPPKFSQYQEPGGKNYRELLLTLPERAGRVGPKFQVKEMPDGSFAVWDYANDRTTHETYRTIQSAAQRADEFNRANPNEPIADKNFSSSHFPEKNILAHVRFNDRVDAQGKKVLFLEELQSDWAQKGRREGFKTDGSLPTGWKVERVEGGDGWGNLQGFAVKDDTGKFIAAGDTAEAAIRNASQSDFGGHMADLMRVPRSGDGRVPSAPFVGKTEAWTELALKRMLRYAAENGYDKIAWTPGETQAKRYDLSKQISRITLESAMGGGGKDYLAAYDLDGRRVIDKTVTPNELPDIIGKDAAEKLLAQEPKRISAQVGEPGDTVSIKEISGLDLAVGGEGMKGYYDQIVPSVASKLGKKWGAKVGETEFATGETTKNLDGDAIKAEATRQTEEGDIGAGYLLRNLARAREVTDAMTAMNRMRGESLSRYGVTPESFKIAEDYIKQNSGSKAIPAHSMDITPEMRQSITGEGLPLFATDKGNGPRSLSVEDVKANFKGYPVEQTEAGFKVTLPGGRKFAVEHTGHIDLNPEALERGHGKSALEDVKSGTQQIVGSYRRIGPESIIQVADQGTLPHEVWHGFMDHVASPKERRIAERDFAEQAKKEGRAVEEVAADSYREYFNRRRAAEAEGKTAEPKGFIDRVWSKVYEFFRNAYRSILPNMEYIQEQLYKGKPWERGGEATGPDSMEYQISPEQARLLGYKTQLPTDATFNEAVKNSPAAKLADDGLLIDLVRYQKPEQAGAESVRTGVFYLPEGAAQAKHYKTGKIGYGGTEKIAGPTLLKKPLFVKGGTGGTAPKAAYDSIKGKGAYEAMRSDILKATAYGYGQAAEGRVQRVAEVLDKYGADSNLATEIVRNSREGNTLPYAIQENIVAHAVRDAGYDSVLGWSKGKSGPFLSEVFDVREDSYPMQGEPGTVHPAFGEEPKYSTTPPPAKSAAPTQGPAKPKATLAEKAIEGWKSGLVSGPGTILVANPLSNIGEAGMRGVEAAAAGPIDAALTHWLGGERTRFSGEAVKQAEGIIPRLPGAFNVLADRLKNVLNSSGKIEGKAGQVIRVPFQLLDAGDATTAHVNEGVVTRGLAYREGQRLGKTAAEKARIEQDLIQNPTADFTKQVNREVQRRQWKGDPEDPVDMIGKFNHFIQQHPLLQVIAPFIRTPGEIAKVAIQRSPLGIFKAVADVKTLKAAIAKGAAPELVSKLKGEAADSISRAMVGTTILGAFAAYAKAGGMTGSGPTDQKQKSLLRETGWQPYSFVVNANGKKAYIPFNRFEPVSTILGLSADLAEAKNQKNGEEVANKVIGSIASNITSKTYLQGIADAAEFINDPMKAGKNYLSSLTSSLVPNIVAKAAQAIDPKLRDVTPESAGIAGLGERLGKTVLSRIPGASMTLPAKESATGNEIERPGNALSRFLSPIQVSTEKGGTELEQSLVDLGYVPSQPSREIKIPGKNVKVRLTDSEYNIVQKANSEASQYLRENLARLKKLPKDEQEKAARKVFDRARESARNRLFASPSFRARAKSEVANARQS